MLQLHNLDQIAQPQDPVVFCGWVRFKRNSKHFSFLEVTNGTTVKGLQVLADETLPNYDEIKKLTTGSSVRVEGA